jgi:hypothetical protein
MSNRILQSEGGHLRPRIEGKYKILALERSDKASRRSPWRLINLFVYHF